MDRGACDAGGVSSRLSDVQLGMASTASTAALLPAGFKCTDNPNASLWQLK